MRFDCTPKPKKPKKDLYVWHSVFAWFPVRVGNECIWLEFVERKRVTNFNEHLESINSSWPIDYKSWWEYKKVKE